jgi:hypothetical protein
LPHTLRHRYCPSCNTNLDVVEQLVRDMQDISTIIGTGAGAVIGGAFGRDTPQLGSTSAGRSAMDLYERTQEIFATAPPKKKRKVSKYQKEFGKQFKMLKKAHPRTKPSKLMKKAHSKTKACMRRMK